MKFSKPLMVGVTLLIGLSFIGCGAIFNGSSQIIEVQGTPAGSTITGTPSIGEYTTPTSLRLERKNSYTLTFKKEGYKSAQVQIKKSIQGGIIVLDVLFTGLLGVIIDAATGSWYKLSPDQVLVALEKVDIGMTGPDTIEISLGRSPAKVDGFEIETSSEGVVVDVEIVR